LALGPDITPPDTSLLSLEERKVVRRSLTVIAALSVAGMIGTGSSLYLVNHYPLLLIALSPLGRNLILVAPTVDPVAFMLVAVLRRGLFYFLCFDLGGAMGPAGIRWLEERAARFAKWVRWLEDLFGKAPRVVVLTMAGPTVSMLAGMSRMPRKTYVLLAFVSLVVRMAVILAFGEVLREPIEYVLVWIDVYWVEGTIVMVLGLLSYQWWRVRRARSRVAEGV
jgi:membrane protein DedA with SNARE-associated domain